MGRRDPAFLAVGHLSKAHGIKGELSVWPLTDHPEGTFAPGVVLLLADVEGTTPDPDLPPLRVVAARTHRQGYLVAFGGVDTRNEAEALVGRYLLRERDALEPREAGEVFYHELLGSEVVTADGRVLGKVVEVYELKPSDLLEVRGRDGQYMIPFRKEVVVDMDIEAGRLVVDPPEGLLDL
jgi:16S rRNA processing protein RimM